MQPLILASSSPYRKSLLNQLCLPFTTASPDIDETPYPHETPDLLVRRLAQTKAQTIASQYPDTIVIGADQVAVCNRVIFGKPGNRSAAIQQLQNLSNHRAIFHSGLCVINTQTQHTQCDSIDTEVHFKALSLALIQRYVEKENAFDCAGAFKSEALGIALCEKIVSDDPTALIGLPLIRLTQMLEATGIPVI